MFVCSSFICRRLSFLEGREMVRVDSIVYCAICLAVIYINQVCRWYEIDSSDNNNRFLSAMCVIFRIVVLVELCTHQLCTFYQVSFFFPRSFPLNVAFFYSFFLARSELRTKAQRCAAVWVAASCLCTIGQSCVRKLFSGVILRDKKIGPMHFMEWERSITPPCQYVDPHIPSTMALIMPRTIFAELPQILHLI